MIGALGYTAPVGGFVGHTLNGTTTGSLARKYTLSSDLVSTNDTPIATIDLFDRSLTDESLFTSFTGTSTSIRTAP